MVGVGCGVWGVQGVWGWGVVGGVGCFGCGGVGGVGVGGVVKRVRAIIHEVRKIVIFANAMLNNSISCPGPTSISGPRRGKKMPPDVDVQHPGKV